MAFLAEAVALTLAALYFFMVSSFREHSGLERIEGRLAWFFSAVGARLGAGEIAVRGARGRDEAVFAP